MEDGLFIQKAIEVKKQEEEMMKKYGWIIHFVFDTDGSFNGLSNIHTHGVLENFNHKDLQVVLPLPPETIQPVLANIVGQIKAGMVFVPNLRIPNVISGYDVCFKEVKEGGRTLLRLIIPDSQGRFPEDKGCEDTYNRQYELFHS